MVKAKKIKVLTKAKGKQVSFSRLVFKQYFYFFFLLDISFLVLIYFLRSHFPPEIPLFYGLAEGGEQLANSMFLALPVLLSLLILLFNMVVSLFINNIFFKKTLLVSAFGANILIVITTLKIFFLVGNF